MSPGTSEASSGDAIFNAGILNFIELDADVAVSSQDQTMRYDCGTAEYARELFRVEYCLDRREHQWPCCKQVWGATLEHVDGDLLSDNHPDFL